MREKLSVIVPCYNESASLARIVQRFSESSPEKNGFELVMVDNGSTDDSAKKLKLLASKNKFVRIATVKKNQGYGFGIMAGLNAAKGEFLCWTHADMQTDPLDAVEAYRIARGCASPQETLVKGARKGRALFDAFFTFGMSCFALLVLGKWMPDINAQPNLFHRSFLARMRKGAPDDFSFDMYVFFLAKKCGMEVKRFPVDFSPREHGKSHWNIGIAGKWKFIKRTAEFTLEMRKRMREI